jgi:hypothetical protein
LLPKETRFKVLGGWWEGWWESDMMTGVARATGKKKGKWSVKDFDSIHVKNRVKERKWKSEDIEEQKEDKPQTIRTHRCQLHATQRRSHCCRWRVGDITWFQIEERYQ